MIGVIIFLIQIMKFILCAVRIGNHRLIMELSSFYKWREDNYNMLFQFCVHLFHCCFAENSYSYEVISTHLHLDCSMSDHPENECNNNRGKVS